MLICVNEHGRPMAMTCSTQDHLRANEPTASAEKLRDVRQSKLTWNQMAGSIGAGFAAASTAVCVSFTAVAQPQFEEEDNSNLRMNLETASWFGKNNCVFE